MVCPHHFNWPFSKHGAHNSLQNPTDTNGLLPLRPPKTSSFLSSMYLIAWRSLLASLWNSVHPRFLLRNIKTLLFCAWSKRRPELWGQLGDLLALCEYHVDLVHCGRVWLEYDGSLRGWSLVYFNWEAVSFSLSALLVEEIPKSLWACGVVYTILET